MPKQTQPTLIGNPRRRPPDGEWVVHINYSVQDYPRPELLVGQDVMVMTRYSKKWLTRVQEVLDTFTDRHTRSGHRVAVVRVPPLKLSHTSASQLDS